MAARREPGPESARLVTAMTAPPRPPGVIEPNPSAPGKAGIGSGTAVSSGVGVRDGRSTPVKGTAVGVGVLDTQAERFARIRSSIPSPQKSDRRLFIKV